MKQKEFFDLADEMEKACGDWENSKGLSDRARSELIAKVEAMDLESAEKKTEKPKSFHVKKRYFLILAAALVLLMGVGVVGDRAWIANSNDMERDTEVTTKVNTEEKESELREEEEIYQEIGEQLGIAPMRLGYKPEGMVLDSYVIMEDTGWAYVNYLYNGDLVCVQMAKSSVEVSSNIQWDGNAERLDYASEWYDVEAYCIEAESNNYGASISYGNGYYNVFGIFSDEQEFIEILKEIYFKTV